MIFSKQGGFEYLLKRKNVCMYGEGKIPSPYTHTHTPDRPPKKVIQSDLLQTCNYIQQIRFRPIIL